MTMERQKKWHGQVSWSDLGRLNGEVSCFFNDIKSKVDTSK